MSPRPYSYLHTTCAVNLPNVSQRSCLANGAVVEKGHLLAEAPCNRHDYRLSSTPSRCEAKDLIDDIDKGTVTTKELEVVVARYADDVSWLDSYDAVRTVYDHSQQAPCPDGVSNCVRLSKNVGREAHVFLFHLYHNYDKLADRTVFLHGTKPSCGFFHADGTLGGHLLNNVSVHDYMATKHEVYAPITVAFDSKLERSSWRIGFEDKPVPDEVHNEGRPVPPVPKRIASWSPWLKNPFGQFIRNSWPGEGQPQPQDLYRQLTGKAMPTPIYFAQGAQFSATRNALRRVPRETYRRLLDLTVNATNSQMAFWLEVLWPTLLGAPVPDALYAAAHAQGLKKPAPNIDMKGTDIEAPVTMISPTDGLVDPRPPRCADEVQKLSAWTTTQEPTSTVSSEVAPIVTTINMLQDTIDGSEPWWVSTTTSRWRQLRPLLNVTAVSNPPSNVELAWPTMYMRYQRSHGEPFGRLIASECYDNLFAGLGTPEYDSEFKQRVADPSPLADKSKRIAWVHFPKAGTSFGTALVRVANSSLPEEAAMRECGGCVWSQQCLHNEQSIDFELRYPLRKWAPGVFWTKRSGAFDDHDSPTAENGAAPFEGRLFAMFREPHARHWSSYHHFGRSEFPGETFEHYVQHRARGSATTMVNGQRRNGQQCIRSMFPCDDLVPDVDAAIKRLDSFAFVGLSEEWALSVCLLHVMHGGNCVARVENANSRPNAFSNTTTSASSEAPPKTPETTDPYDEALYAAVTERFRSDLQTHSVSPYYCKRMGCWPDDTPVYSMVAEAERL